MPLKSIHIKKRYRTGESDLVKEFYVPCLASSTMYFRAVGYFTGSGLALAARGLADFMKNNGKMFLIASPNLTEDDIRQINEGEASKEHIVEEVLIRELEGENEPDILRHLSILAAMVAVDRLEIKLAIRTTPTGISRGIYHEKIGVFTDAAGNQVAFTGSSNETDGGLVSNFESIQVFRSWNDPEERVSDIVTDFDHLWHNTTPGLEIMCFSAAVREKLVRAYLPARATIPFDDQDTSTKPTPRDYQDKAIHEWNMNGRCGILKMATGTGKTKTAFFALSSVDASLHLVVIVAPYRHLVSQWKIDADLFGYESVICSSDFPSWKQDLNELYMEFLLSSTSTKLIITTYDTFRTDPFQQRLLKFKKGIKTLIVDEVHQMGAESNRLDVTYFTNRLGLSATPERQFDPVGTQWLFDHIGPIVFELSIKEAIQREILCEYYYFIKFLKLSRGEYEDYQEVADEISKLCAKGASLSEENPDDNKRLGPLLRRRQEIIGSASTKLPALQKTLEEIKEREGGKTLYHTLVYSSSGIFQQCLNLISNILNLRVSKFTYEEDLPTRQELLNSFKNKAINILLAKKCLDMGVDIPATKYAIILASSSNPMEFVQRRGRVLRKFEGKKYAYIYDYFVLPPDTAASNRYDRMLVERELNRALEFVDTAKNSATSRSELFKVMKKYNLLHL